MKLRELNRWHFALAVFLLFPTGFLGCYWLTRSCRLFVNEPGRTCSVDQTLEWLRGGDGWLFWLGVAVPIVMAIALCVGLLVPTLTEGWDKHT